MTTSWNAVKTVGRYQWVLLIPYVFAVIFCHWANMGILVIVPKLRFRCLDYSSGFRNLSLKEQLRLMPENECWKPKLDPRWTSAQLRGMNRSDLELTKCDYFDYDHEYFDFSTTEQFDLVCDKAWMIPMAGTIYMIGFFTAALGSGTISDRFGRKTATIGGCMVGFVGNMIAAYSPYVELFLVGRYLVAVGDISTYTCGLVLTTELLRKDQRIIPKVLASTFGSFGSGLIGVVQILLRDSRHYQTLTAMGFLIVGVSLWLIAVESPRWLSAENRHEDANEVVKYIAGVNNISESQLQHLHRTAEDEDAVNSSGGPASMLDLFRTPLLRKRTFILIFLWFSLVFVYYALTYNLGMFYDDVRISLMISGVLEVASLFISIFSIDRTGRPLASFIFMGLAGLCCFLMIPFIDEKGNTVLLSLALIGKMMAVNQFFIIYITTQELFPTVCRNMGLGCCSSVARIAGMLAPQIVLLNQFWPAFTVLVLGFFGLVGGGLAPFLPDTTGIELSQTLYQGEHFIEDHVFSLRWPTKERIERINKTLHASSQAGATELQRPVNAARDKEDETL